jgi:hypothetical protein
MPQRSLSLGNRPILGTTTKQARRDGTTCSPARECRVDRVHEASPAGTAHSPASLFFGTSTADPTADRISEAIHASTDGIVRQSARRFVTCLAARIHADGAVALANAGQRKL